MLYGLKQIFQTIKLNFGAHIFIEDIDQNILNMSRIILCSLPFKYLKTYLI